MRIAIVCPYDLSLPGGVQAVATQLTRGIERAGHTAELIGPGHSENWGGLGRSVTIPANGSRVPVALSVGTRRRVVAALEGADVVHVHEPLVPLVGPAALGAGPPTVATFHADPPNWVRWGYLRAPRALAERFQRATLTAVSDTAAGAIPATWGAVRVIPNGIEIPAPSAAGRRDESLVAFLGRDEPRKGLDVLLEAWPEVAASVRGARLVVMGARRPSPHPGVEFRGRVDEAEKAETLARAAILVTPNLGGESFGIVGVEGQAAGCAVVASDLPAFRHALGGAARFVPPGNARALAAAVTALLLDRASVSDLEVQGRAHAANYAWDRVVDAYLDAYEHARRVG